MSNSSRGRVIVGQKLSGVHIIDVKGAPVGIVKDSGADFDETELTHFVATRAGTDVKIPWNVIRPVEEAVLLAKLAD